MDWISSFIAVILLFAYFTCEEWCEFKCLQFCLTFVPFCLKFFIKSTKMYFKLIFKILFAVKNLLFISLVPLLFQFSFIFYYFFSIIWDGYLLFSVYSLILACLPYFFFKFFTTNETTHNYFSHYQIKFAILFIFYFNYTFDLSLSLILLLISFEIFSLKKLLR